LSEESHEVTWSGKAPSKGEFVEVFHQNKWILGNLSKNNSLANNWTVEISKTHHLKIAFDNTKWRRPSNQLKRNRSNGIINNKESGERPSNQLKRNKSNSINNNKELGETISSKRKLENRITKISINEEVRPIKDLKKVDETEIYSKLISYLPLTPTSMQINGFKWKNNSCYLDATFIALFFVLKDTIPLPKALDNKLAILASGEIPTDYSIPFLNEQDPWENISNFILFYQRYYSNNILSKEFHKVASFIRYSS
jgi:hypothetical protein